MFSTLDDIEIVARCADCPWRVFALEQGEPRSANLIPVLAYEHEINRRHVVMMGSREVGV